MLIRLPHGWDTIIRLESVDDVSKTIRSFRGERLPTCGSVEIIPGSILVLHAGGSRYWPGVTDVAQVTRAGTLVTLIDDHGEIRGAGPGRLVTIGRRTRALLERMRAAHLDEREREAVRALRAVDAARLALVVSLSHGEGFQAAADAEAEFDPEVAA